MITREEVLRIAQLARLRLEEEEIERFQRDLDEILTYVESLKEVDTTGVEPRSQFVGQTNVLRSDEVRPSLPVEEALRNAPERAGNYFKVPRVVDK